MNKKLRIVFIGFLTAVLAMDCGTICGCYNPEPIATFYIFYKSASNPDLLQPQTGIYNSSDVKIYEVINNNGTLTQSPAVSVKGQYVSDGDPRQTGYFINYQSSILQRQSDLTKTLIQLKQGLTDTLTYSLISSSSYPQQIFYNGKPVWKIGDSMEITIVR
jgi:hypothetical protein